MNEKYTIPADAITVWLSADRQFLYLALDAIGGGGGGHVVSLPTDKCSIEKTDGGSTLARQAGWATLLEVLKSRQTVSRAKGLSIGEKGRPVQYDIEAMLRAGGSTAPQRYDAKGEKEQKTVEGLDELGLDE